MNNAENNGGAEWDGTERRMSPIEPRTRLHAILSGITALASVAALAFSLIAFSDRLDAIQRSRVASATDTCYLIRSAVIIATPPAKLPQASAYLDRLGLINCQAFGRNVTRLRHR